MTEKDKDIQQLDIENEAPAMEENVPQEKPVEEPAEEAKQDLEKIVEEGEEKPEQAFEEAPEKEAGASGEESETEEAEEEVKVYEPHEKKDEEEAPAIISNMQDNDKPQERQTIIPAVQYSKSLERERKIAQEVKKRQRRPMVFILAMCALLIVLAIIFNAVMKDVNQSYTAPTPVPTQTVIIPTPTVEIPAQPAEPQQGEEVQVEATPEQEVPKVSTYEIFKEDISWTAARDKCVEMGGHLAVISTKEEFDKVVGIAKTQGVDKLWIGCQRVNGNMVWVTEDQVEYYPWAQGEPTGVDSFDGAAEDYVLLWNNGGWFYNDSRNDPAAEFPQWYSGTIGYVCEFEE